MLLIKKVDLELFVEFKKNCYDRSFSKFHRFALFFASELYEGFGISVLESFACDCPALLSNGGSLPELVEIPAYFDPSRSTIYTLFQI
jgi:glycosyltransferase involved in cell wall biosynthesis